MIVQIASSEQASHDFTDRQLQQAATAALGDREGAILIIDPQTGRLRAVVNPRIAFAQAFPPGSTIKPFTALTALRAGLLARETQRQCSGRYARAAYEILCAHPKSQTPFDLPQALAYSCNDYFAHVGERLSGSAVNATLISFGLGKRTGVNVGESAGRLLNGEWRAREALGDSENLLVTPVQLLSAYSALVNGGRLYRPQQSGEENFAPQLVAKLNLADAQRAVLLEGMRGAVTYGTALPAQLAALPFYLFGKTGTSEASNGFQTQGWFVGFGADARKSGVPAPDEIKLGVLVFLKRSHGSQGAKLVRALLEPVSDDEATGRQGDGAMASDPRSAIRAPRPVRVHLVKENITRELPFEAYVAGVVAAEGSTEERVEALKAQAVASRTYAWQNRARHAREGFDFCSTTHCQRFWWPEPAKLREAVRQAVERTAGEVLLDAQGRVAESYFHAACGGQTANLEALWSVKAPPHLRGVRDDFCAERPNRHWSAEIEAAQMLKAVRSDPRTAVGAQLRGLEIQQRDAQGRAQTLLLEGERRKVISGWDFKIIVGRSLGWAWLKSSWFDVRRSRAGFVFQGRGFGHGLGLCQEGTHVMAERGMDYRRIVEFYFPGVSVGKLPEAVPRAVANGASAANRLRSLRSLPLAVLIHSHAQQKTVRRATLASEHFRVDYPSNVPPRAVAETLRLLAAARAQMLPRLEAAALRWAENAPVELFVHATPADFMAATGQPGWVAAVTRGRRIETQPLALLQRRGLLDTTLKHEFVHVVIETLGKGQTPRWLAEGLALHYAGEGQALAQVQIKEKLSLVELERRLAKPANAAVTRVLYAQAYREVQTLLRAEAEAGVWRRVAASSKGQAG